MLTFLKQLPFLRTDYFSSSQEACFHKFIIFVSSIATSLATTKVYSPLRLVL